jgi:hypothetical protein
MLVLLMGGFTEYSVEMGVIYIPSFIKIGSGSLKSLGGYTYEDNHTDTEIVRQEGDVISLRLSLRNEETRLKDIRSTLCPVTVQVQGTVLPSWLACCDGQASHLAVHRSD